MNPVKLHLRLQFAPANLLRTAVRGSDRSVYIPILQADDPSPGVGECIWSDGVESLLATAREGEYGPAVDLRLAVNLPPTAPAALAAAAAATPPAKAA